MKREQNWNVSSLESICQYGKGRIEIIWRCSCKAEKLDKGNFCDENVRLTIKRRKVPFLDSLQD